MAAGIDETATSNSSRRLVTGKLAALCRARALEASRLVISASIRVRRKSSGLQRWVLAVTSSSGAMAAHGGQLQVGAARRPGRRPAAGAAAVTGPLPDGVVGQRPGRHDAAGG